MTPHGADAAAALANVKSLFDDVADLGDDRACRERSQQLGAEPA